MAKPTNRQEFKEYCLRKLGHPVIQINVSDEQVEDRIDEAFAFFSDYHYNGSEHVYLKHQITQEDNLLLSEDYHFCRKWRSLGDKVYVDKSITLNHIGTHTYQSSQNHSMMI